LAVLTRECRNGVSVDPMAVRLLRQKVPFESWQIENLKAEMFQLPNGLWFSREMVLPDDSLLAFSKRGVSLKDVIAEPGVERKSDRVICE